MLTVMFEGTRLSPIISSAASGIGVNLFIYIHFLQFFFFDDRERTQDFPHVFAWKT